jgi:hypothetical protein
MVWKALYATAYRLSLQLTELAFGLILCAAVYGVRDEEHSGVL